MSRRNRQKFRANKTIASQILKRVSSIANHNIYKPVLIEQYGNKCMCCGTTKGLTIDHIKPRAAGGQTVIENLQLLCWDCNQLKADQEKDYRPYPLVNRGNV